MPKENIDWKNAEWCLITNKYGKFVSYNQINMNDGYECLNYQYPIREMIETKDYDIFIDIGAYIGYFSIIASKLCKKVMSYEACPFLFGILLNNTKFLSNIECKYCWVSNKNDIPMIGNSFDMVSITKDYYEGEIYHPNRNKYNISVVTIDDELLPLKNEKMFIKMDIEGNEEKALKGATETLKQSNIHWYIDVHEPNIKVENIMNFFKDREIKRFDNTLMIKGEKNVT